MEYGAKWDLRVGLPSVVLATAGTGREAEPSVGAEAVAVAGAGGSGANHSAGATEGVEGGISDMVDNEKSTAWLGGRKATGDVNVLAGFLS